MTEEKMVGWHYQLDGHEFEQAPGDGEGQGSLACCNLQGRKKSDMTEQLKNKILRVDWQICKHNYRGYCCDGLY